MVSARAAAVPRRLRARWRWPRNSRRDTADARPEALKWRGRRRTLRFQAGMAVAPTKCDISLPSTGRLVLSGTARRLTIRIVQGSFNDREYAGSMETDGTFSGSFGLAARSVGARAW